jgi:hypothetical protein
VSPILKIGCLRLEDNHVDLGFVDKVIKGISMARSYIKWLGSIEIFMTHVYVFYLILQSKHLGSKLKVPT